MMQQPPDRTRLAQSACHDFPNANRLTLRLPTGWECVRKTAPGMLPELRIGPAGERARLMLSVIPFGRDEPAMPLAALREQVQATVDALSGQVVKEVIDVHDMHCVNATGYVYRLTDAHPDPDEFLFMTQGMLAIGATQLLFSVFSNDGEDAIELAARSIVQSARLTYVESSAPCGSGPGSSTPLDQFLAIAFASEACLFVQDFPDLVESLGDPALAQRLIDRHGASCALVSIYCLQRIARAGASLAMGPAAFADVDGELLRLLRILVGSDAPEHGAARAGVFQRLQAMTALSGSDLRLRDYLRLALMDDLLPNGFQEAPDPSSVARQVLAEIVPTLSNVADRFLRAHAQSLFLHFLLPHVSGRLASNIEDGIDAGLAASRGFEMSGLRKDWARVHLHLGIAYASRVFDDRNKNLQEAVAHYDMALACSDGEPAIQRAANSNIGLAGLELAGQDDKSWMLRAREHLQTALTLAEKGTDSLATAAMQLNLGNANLKLASTDIDALESAIAWYVKAEAVLTRAVDPLDWAGLQHNLGSAWAAREIGDENENIAHAIEHFLQALTARTLDDDAIGHMVSSAALADAYMRQSDFEAAGKHYGDAVRADRTLLSTPMLRSEMRVHFEHSQSLYTDTAYCLLKLGRPMEALATVERGRARELQQLLHARSAASDHTADTDLTTALRMMLDDVSSDATPLSSDSREFQDKRRLFKARKTEIQAELAQRGEAGQAAPGDRPAFTPNKLLASIDTQHTLAMTLVSRTGSATLVLRGGAAELTATDVVWHRGFTLADATELLLGSKRLGLAKGWIPAYFGNKKDQGTWKSAISATGRLLWDRLLREIWEALRAPGVDLPARLVIVPPPLLALVPWHGAWRELDGEVRYACDDVAIGYAPSLTVYASLRREAATRVAVGGELRSLVVADADLDLPFAALEGLQVARMAGTRPEDLLAREAASFVAVSRGFGNKDLLHFACHGVFFPHDPMGSYLSLGRSGVDIPGTTGNLRLREILGWSDVRARLVTLSACESAITELARVPNESLSLASAWLSAGALAVVSTLWQVDDFCTLVLMKRFYADYLGAAQGASGTVGDGAVALRQAQRWLKSATAGELAQSVAAIQALPGLRAEQVQLLQAKRTEFDAMAPDLRPYSQPYWWSAFTYSGL